MDSPYAVLADAVPTKIRDQDLRLNVLETWECLLFQTLQEKHLSNWLDQTDNCPHPGQHSNIAVPLYQQRVGGIHIEDHSSQFGMLRYSKRTAKQDDYWDVVRAHHALGSSRDPKKYAVYWKHRDLASQAVHQHRVHIRFYLTLVITLYKCWCAGYSFSASANGFRICYINMSCRIRRRPLRG